MSDDRISDGRTESPAWTLPAMVVLGLIAIGGLAVGWSASSKLDGTQQAVAAQLKTAEQSMQQVMASLIRICLFVLSKTIFQRSHVLLHRLLCRLQLSCNCLLRAIELRRSTPPNCQSANSNQA